jgi:hypothetical protein
MARMIEGDKQKDWGRVLLEAERQELLAVLKRAATDSEFLARLSTNPQAALKEYEVLTAEERAALASGDIRRIEAWVGKLDKELSTWLWCRLSQEKW